MKFFLLEQIGHGRVGLFGHGLFGRIRPFK